MTDTAYAPTEAGAGRSGRSFRGFACPHEAFDDALLEELQVDYSRRLINTLLRVFGETLQRHGDIEPFIRDWRQGEVGFADVWDPTFGAVRELLATPDQPPSAVLPRFAALALRLCEVGATGSFCLSFVEPCVVRFGHLLLPAADAISVEAARGYVRIDLRSGPDRCRLELERGARRWDGDGGDKLPQLETPAGLVTLLPPWLAEARSFVTLLLDEDPQLLSQVQRKFEALYSLVAARTPHYLRWFERAVRFLVPFNGPPGEAQGGSFQFRPGAVSLSHEAAELQLADFLAHEATHQYFYMLQPMRRMDNGSDDQLYLNPIINAYRRIDYMALAFHAFANDVLFCRDYLKTGPDPANYCTYREMTLMEALAPFRELLARTRALTDVGRGLVDPLLERL
jgi:HEXXH motif-containing protein